MKYAGALAGGAHTERKENMVEKTLKISARKGGKRRVGFLSSVVGAVKSAFWTVIDAFQRFFKFLWSKSKFTKAAFFLVLALFIVGACTIGGFNGGGGAYLAEAESTVAFYLDYQDGATLDKVYLNAGTAYAETGTAFTVTVRTSSNSSLSWITSYGFGAKKISNIYSSDAEALGTNYDWVQLRDERIRLRSLPRAGWCSSNFPAPCSSTKSCSWIRAGTSSPRMWMKMTCPRFLIALHGTTVSFAMNSM